MSITDEELAPKIYAWERSLPPRFQKRSRDKALFADPEYSQLACPNGLFYMRRLDDDISSSLGKSLLEHKEERKSEMHAFLARHSITIDVGRNEYSEFDDFFAKNVDFSEYREDERHKVSRLWMSVLVDLSLLVGDSLIAKYPALSWKFQLKKPKLAGYKELSLDGIGYEPPEMKNVLWVNPLHEFVGNYGSRFVYDVPDSPAPTIVSLGDIIDGNFLIWLRQGQN